MTLSSRLPITSSSSCAGITSAKRVAQMSGITSLGIRRRLATANSNRYNDSAVPSATAQESTANSIASPTNARAGTETKVSIISIACSCRLKYVYACLYAPFRYSRPGAPYAITAGGRFTPTLAKSTGPRGGVLRYSARVTNALCKAPDMIKALAVPYVTCLKAFPTSAVTQVTPCQSHYCNFRATVYSLLFTRTETSAKLDTGATLDRKVTGWPA